MNFQSSILNSIIHNVIIVQNHNTLVVQLLTLRNICSMSNSKDSILYGYCSHYHLSECR